MKRLNNLCVCVIVALAMVACGGDNGNDCNNCNDVVDDNGSDTGNDSDQPDYCANCGDTDQTDGDVAVQDSDQDTWVCNENGTCCNEIQCCATSGACWVNVRDTVEYEESDNGGDVQDQHCNNDDDCPATTATIYRCSSNEFGPNYCEPRSCTDTAEDCDAEQGQWCDKYTQYCRPEAMLTVLEPYRFLEERVWQCMEGSCTLGELSALTILGWDEEAQGAQTEGPGQMYLTWKYDGDILMVTDNLKEGSVPWYNLQYDNANQILSFDMDVEGWGIRHTSYQQQ